MAGLRLPPLPHHPVSGACSSARGFLARVASRFAPPLRGNLAAGGLPSVGSFRPPVARHSLTSAGILENHFRDFWFFHTGDLNPISTVPIMGTPGARLGNPCQPAVLSAFFRNSNFNHRFDVRPRWQGCQRLNVEHFCVPPVIEAQTDATT